jgi:hypothetical protein
MGQFCAVLANDWPERVKMGDLAEINVFVMLLIVFVVNSRYNFRPEWTWDNLTG